jgi:hypothetical protein
MSEDTELRAAIENDACGKGKVNAFSSTVALDL